MDANHARAANTGYFALIPGSVRFDDGLSANAKLFFGEIVSLAQGEGYCYASNAYFAEAFGLTERSVTRIVALLAERGHIKIKLLRAKNTGQITGRRIYPLYNPAIPEDDVIEEEIDGLHHQTKKSGRPDKKVFSPPTEMSTGLIMKIEKNKDNISPISPAGKKPKGTADDTEARRELQAWAEARFHGAQAAEMTERLMQFCDMRAAKGKGKAMGAGRAVTALTNKLQRYSGGSFAAMLELLDKSIIAKWDSVYPLKADELQSFGVAAPDAPAATSPAVQEEGGIKWL